MAQMHPAPDFKQEMEKTLAKLRTLRDDVRVRAHLASMEVQEEWKKLEPHLAEAEQAGVELRNDARTALKKAMKRLSKIHAAMGEPAAEGRAAEEEPKAQAETKAPEELKH